MKKVLILLALVVASAVSAQTAVTPRNALKRLDLPPRSGPGGPPPGQAPGQAPPTAPSAPRYALPPPVAAPAKPTEIVTKIDRGLAASPIKVIGTADGLRGKMYVTNLSQEAITPTAQFAVLNRDGVQIATAAQKGEELEAGAFVKMEVLSSNANAGDFKLMKLSAGMEKK